LPDGRERGEKAGLKEEVKASVRVGELPLVVHPFGFIVVISISFLLVHCSPDFLLAWCLSQGWLAKYTSKPKLSITNLSYTDYLPGDKFR
jgi:hypothetical protein